MTQTAGTNETTTTATEGTPPAAPNPTPPGTNGTTGAQPPPTPRANETGNAPGRVIDDVELLDDELNSGDSFTLKGDAIKRIRQRAAARERERLTAQHQAERAAAQAEADRVQREQQEAARVRNQEFEQLANERQQRVAALEQEVAARDARLGEYKPYEDMIGTIAARELKRLPDTVRAAVKPLLDNLSPLQQVEWLRDNVERLAPAAPPPPQNEQPDAGANGTTTTGSTTTVTTTNGTTPPPPAQTATVPPTPPGVGQEAFKGLNADEVERGRQDFARELRRTW